MCVSIAFCFMRDRGAEACYMADFRANMLCTKTTRPDLGVFCSSQKGFGLESQHPKSQSFA